MYKKIFMGIAAVAALTLVSCSSEDLNSLSDNSSKNEAISFDGYLGRSAVAVNGSRGSELTKEKLKTDGFGVFGNYSEDSKGTKTVYGDNWFKNQKVTYKTSAWTYDPLKYWLPQGHIDFLAYAPYDSQYDNQQITNDNQKLDFTVDSDIKKQKDLLWANATNKTMADKTVTFTFKHALSRLGYTVKLNKEYTGTTITLNKITLAGSKDGAKKAFYPKGTIDLSTGDWTPSTTDDKLKFEWFTTTSGKELSTTAADNEADNYLFVIPQKFSASPSDELYVIVEYTIKDYNGVATPMTNTVYKQLDKVFEQGKAYTINLTIGLTPIEFNADVTPWTDDNNKNTDIPVTWN